jgi:peptide deformylase
MAVRPVVKYPDPRLRQPTRRVAAIGDDVRALVTDLVDTMADENGAGIAAIQIGAPEQIFLIEGEVAGKGEGAPPVVLINPEIVWLSDETEIKEEGCLSFPNIYVPIKRSLKARVRATGLDGQTFELEGEGLCARAIQHEYDHLNGKLMVDFVGPLKKQMIQRKMKKLAREEAEGGAAGDDDEPKNAKADGDESERAGAAKRARLR